MRVLGIDPGSMGAIALIVDGRLDTIHDMPILHVRRGGTDKAEVDGYSLAELFRKLQPNIAYIEQVGGIPGQSAPAAFNFGRAAGAVEYALKTLGVRVEMVPPATWKKDLKIKKGKDDSRACAMRFWPAQADLFKRKKDDGRAESALVAEWGRMQQEGVSSVFG